MALAGKNVFALLNDDAEDAGFDSVNTAALKPTPVMVPKETAPSKTETSKAPVKAQNQKSSTRKPRGAPRNADGAIDPSNESGKVQRAPKPRGNASHENTRNERRSHTGRGKEVKKGGAGGRYTVGNERRDAARGESAANKAFADGASVTDAVDAVHEAEGDGETPVVDIEGGESTNVVEGENGVAEEPKEEEVILTFEEAMALKKSLRPELAGLEIKEIRKANDGADLKDLKKLEKESVDFVFAQGLSSKSGGRKGKNGGASGAKAEDIAVDLTQQLFKGRTGDSSAGGGPRGSDRRGGDRSGGRRGGTGGGRSYNKSGPGSSAPNMSDPSAFPTLGM
uniref:Hyaluronan/mRNA-binding protein domain-containing protein n=1 Tax=Timspurckia oligopyrenoides TaxID=708627 RepID=A0A7S0ZHY0_9RHOD|mmetsp:Transcript_5979/g.10621  ORF Transcript_5979/g.10621 Transcript_5979/m.10621 type:complete len:339 (+) Transcript_5979:176-1192(+)